MENKKKVILDCDPGHDDAFGIMLAVQHLDVLGITTVSYTHLTLPTIYSV